MRKLWFLLPLYASFVFASPPVARHRPMHPSNTEKVTFEAVATGNIDKVRLSYRRAQLSIAGDGSAVVTPVENDTQIKLCDPAGSQPTLPCAHTMTTAFPAKSLVTFTATSWDAAGRTETEEYSFAAGDYPWPKKPIPIRVRETTRKALDAVFVPDTDITVADFRAQLDDVLELYFKAPQIVGGRAHHNFYYSSIQGNYESGCQFTNPTNMAELVLIADSVVFLHKDEERDCSSGNRFSSEINYDKSILHESGHSFYGLQDEYCCDSSYTAKPCVPNIYASLAKCEADAPGLGYPKSACAQLVQGPQTLNFWRIDPNTAGGCLMGNAQHTAASVFQKACVRRMRWRYAKCAAGECMPATECP